MILKARYVVPVDGPVIESGAVAVAGGRIAAVGRTREFSGQPTVDYGDAVICPGFVNAHTHLDLTMLAGLVPPDCDFVGWLRRLMAILPSQSPLREQVAESVRSGVAQSLASGVTSIGDITRTPDITREILASSVLRGVSFGEVIAVGNRRALLSERLDAAVHTTWQSERTRIGISPHAPYTVEPDAMRACAQRAREINGRLCIHLAETADEELFTRSREGPLADHLRSLGVWDDSIPVSGCGPVQLAVRAGLLGRDTVIAHANYVTDKDVDLIAASGASVAYCPRTHRAFQHPPHRFRDMLAAGINVCIGTDSLASNPSLSILDELRFVRRECPSLPVEELLSMGTLRGAQALGMSDQVGSLTEGKAADLVVIPLENAGSTGEWASVLDAPTPPAAVYVSGVLHFVS